jgi:hypothetical protein
VNISYAGAQMTDILTRLQTVVEHARIGVDPVWLKMAITEIQRLRTENISFADAPIADIVEQLRQRACQAGEPWTGDNPKSDHGHTDCWLHHQSITEIQRLRTENTELATLLLSQKVFVHENITTEVDEILKPYIGGTI